MNARTLISREQMTHPERVIWIGDRQCFVHAYDGGEWLEVLSVAGAFIQELVGLMEAGIVPRFDIVTTLVARHRYEMIEVIAQAADVSASEVEHARPREVDTLLLTWWGANGADFIWHARMHVETKQAEQAAVARRRQVDAEATPLPTPRRKPAKAARCAA